MKHISTVLFVVFLSTASAQTGGSDVASSGVVASTNSGLWTNPSNWDCDCVPEASHEVTILDGHAIEVGAADTVRVESMSISTGGALILSNDVQLELTASLASNGDVHGTGRVAFVGEGPQTCGPAVLKVLDCGVGQLTFVDWVTVTSVLDLSTANVSTEGFLVLEGDAGITSAGGTLSGDVERRFDWTKTSPYTHQMGVGMKGAVASSILDQPGAAYAKQWLEAGTTYLSLVGTDTLLNGEGYTCSLPVGTYSYQFEGEAVLNADLAISAEAASASWRGWNLLSNPLTGFVDLAATSTAGPGSLGALYQWVDTLQTWVAQVGGVGQYGRAGILAPGEAFWTIADTAFSWSFDEMGLVEQAAWKSQSERLPESLLALEINDGLMTEQCAILIGGGNVDFNRSEDAPFSAAFRGRNNLDFYSQTSDSVNVMVNKTSNESQTIPLWLKAGSGSLLTLQVPDLASNLCLVLEDVETGWTGGIEPGFSYEFSTTTSSDHHRFNLLVAGAITAEVSDAACESAQDGAIAIEGPDLTTSFSLVDAFGNPAGTFAGEGSAGTYSGLSAGTYTITALTEGCADIAQSVEVGGSGAGDSPFDIVAMLDHIGCYEDEGGVSLAIEGGVSPYTVSWSHGVEGNNIDVVQAGIFSAIVTDAAGCQDSTFVEVLAAPHVQANVELDEPVVTLIDGLAEVGFVNTSTGATSYQWSFGDGYTSSEEQPVHAYTAGGSYTVGLNAWNDYCSDTHQIVVTVEVLSTIGSISSGVEPRIERRLDGWSVVHPGESFSLEVFDLTGRQVHQVGGLAGVPVQLNSASIPAVALIRWVGENSGRQKTWRLAR
ncbi:MAG: hypothetical protein CL849_01835 [Crocinitomicaceae bacterium]|nr:hypothetical protein [Crocinitomicaceae bacterium]